MKWRAFGFVALIAVGLIGVTGAQSLTALGEEPTITGTLQNGTQTGRIDAIYFRGFAFFKDNKPEEQQRFEGVGIADSSNNVRFRLPTPQALEPLQAAWCSGLETSNPEAQFAVADLNINSSERLIEKTVGSPLDPLTAFSRFIYSSSNVVIRGKFAVVQVGVKCYPGDGTVLALDLKRGWNKIFIRDVSLQDGSSRLLSSSVTSEFMMLPWFTEPLYAPRATSR